MAAPGVRRQRNRSLGQIPLSSGEIELYSRQDEAARRRHRLLAVREQERRLAQQVTQRYRDNLQKLQRGKSKKTHNQQNLEQQKLLTELHVRYRNSLQNMGTAQRNARLKMLELMEQAQAEKDKWKYNHQVTGKQRTMEAEEAREHEEQLRMARRRQVQQNMERLKLLSVQQRHQASARARREQEAAMQRAKDREEIERLRRMQSPEEVFITPRPREKDALSYQYTRTHCHAPTPIEEKPVTVIRHNRKHPTAMRGEEEAKKYSEAMDVKRERDRLIVEGQKQTAVDRGIEALENVVSNQQGRQALEWLALVDKMERRTHGQELGGVEDYPLDAGNVDGELDDPEQMAERVFARMLELDENSIELSAFSIATDDDQSAGLAGIDHENFNGDEDTEADAGYKINSKAAKHRDSAGSFDGFEARKTGKNKQGEVTIEAPVKPTTFGDLQREEFEKFKKSRDTRERSVPHEALLKPRSGRHEEKVGMSGKSPILDDGMVLGQHSEWGSTTMGVNRATGGDKAQRRDVEESSEGTEDELEYATDRVNAQDNSIERLENRLQDVLDFHLSKPKDRYLTRQLSESERGSPSSSSEPGQRASQLEGAIAQDSQRDRMSRSSYEFSEPSGGSEAASDGSVIATSSESGRSSLPRTSGVAAPSSTPPGIHESSVADMDDFPLAERVEDIRRGSDAVEHEELPDDSHFPKEYSSHIYPGGDSAVHLRDDRFDSDDVAQPTITGSKRSDSAAASSRAEYQSTLYGEEREREGYDNPIEGSRAQDTAVPQSKANAPILADDNIPTGSLDDEADHLESTHFGTRRVQAFDEREGYFSSSSLTSDLEDVQDGANALNAKNSDLVPDDADDRSASESSYAPSQKSLSRLDEVVHTRARSLQQRFIDQHMMSFSSSEDHSEDEGRAEALSSVNASPYDPYRQQMDHRARRRSPSAVSVAQYSLPPSDTRSSFDDSLDHLRPGYGDDSFVHDLVPMFPKRVLPPQSLKEENQAEGEYDVQLVAPNMSRMLTAERRASLDRSRQYPSQNQPQATSTDRSRHEFASVMQRRVEGKDETTQRSFVSSSGRSSPGSFHSETEAKSVDTSVDRSPVQQSQSRAAPEPRTRQLHRERQVRTVEQHGDDRSDISSASGVSSLGFAVQLNLVAGTTRRRNIDDDQEESPKRGDNQRSNRTQANAPDDELDSESERSFASSSSMSMDAHFNYLATMTSAVGKALPLHLRIPAMIYGTKDMTKPLAPMDWSASSVSSVASEGPDQAPEQDSHPTRRISHSNSSSSESVLEEQRASKPPIRRTMEQSDASSDSGSSSETGEESATRVTFDNIKKRISQLPPPPLPSLNMSHPPPPIQVTDRHLSDSLSSSDQHSDTSQLPKRRHLPPPPVGSINMSQPPPMQNFRLSDDSQSSLNSEVQSGDQRLYGAEEETKQDDSSSDSSSLASSRRLSVRIVVPVKKSKSDSDEDQTGQEMSLAEAFQRRHPRFGQRVESHRDKLKRQRDKQPEQEQKTTAKRDTAPSETDDLPPQKQELLNRLATGSRAKISSREMKERSRRLYHQLPEVVERKRQEEMMRRRRERLNELRVQEKKRRLQQKQRRQQQLQRR